MKKTKIVCTIGPASNNELTLTNMINLGMNIARLNFSHGTYPEHKANIELIKSVRKKLDVPVAILLDTKGPEYRIGCFENGKINLKTGDSFSFTSKDVMGNQNIVSVSYKNLPNELFEGDHILLNNGLISLKVKTKTEDTLLCDVIEGGEVSNRKSMSFPNKVLRQIYLSEQDKQDILFGIENDVDFIACSFVSSKDDILAIRKFLNENNSFDIDLIAKIENRAGVNNIKEIIEVSDGILIGRGDMGVEIPYEELPAIQKELIKTCRLMGKRVITATEMLESMIYNPRPTRAEISDVANAVYDGTSAIMLSGETAVGKYPVESVKAMSKIAVETEKNIDYKKRFYASDFKIKNNIDAISHATCGVAMDINAKAIVVCTRTGMTARMVSRFRSPINIIGMTTDEKVWRKLSMSWGVHPILSEEFNSTDVLFYHARRVAKNAGFVNKNDYIIVTAGSPNGESGNTNLIKVEQI